MKDNFIRGKNFAKFKKKAKLTFMDKLKCKFNYHEFVLIDDYHPQESGTYIWSRMYKCKRCEIERRIGEGFLVM